MNSLVGQVQKRDSLFKIAEFYRSGYALENIHDSFFLKKIETYYSLAIKEDSLFFKAYLGLASLYKEECVYYYNKQYVNKKQKAENDTIADRYLLKYNKLHDLYAVKLKKYKEENVEVEEYEYEE